MEAFALLVPPALCAKIVMGTKNLQGSGGEKKPFCGEEKKN